jgi:hypothetical protein
MQLTVLCERPWAIEMRSNLRFWTVPVPDPTFARLGESTDSAGSEFIDGVVAGGEEGGNAALPQAVAQSATTTKYAEMSTCPSSRLAFGGSPARHCIYTTLSSAALQKG